MNLKNGGSEHEWEISSPEDIIEEISDGFAVIDSDGEILEVNNSFLQIFGEEEIEIGKTKVQSLILEGREKFEEFLKDEFERGKNCKNIELVGQGRGGEEVSLILNATRVERVDSDFFLLVFHDITDRKKELEDLREKKKFLDALMMSSPDQIYFKDRDHRFILLNEATAENLGTTKEEAIGKTDFDFFSEDLAEEYYEDEEEVMKTGEPMVNKEEASGHGDEETWNFSTKVPIFDEDGQVIGVAGINRDITERVESKEELDGLEAQLKASLEEENGKVLTSEDDEDFC